MRIMLLIVISILILFAVPVYRSAAMEDPMLARWSDFTDGTESREMIRWLRARARARLTGTGGKEELAITPPPFFGRLGIFLTLKKEKKVRGCFGAFSHWTDDIASLLEDYLVGAMTRDPRYDPLDVSELADTEIIVTVTSPPFAVGEVYGMDVKEYGFMLQCGNGETHIFVPAEIRQLSYISRLASKKSCQISAFRAVTIRCYPWSGDRVP